MAVSPKQLLEAAQELAQAAARSTSETPQVAPTTPHITDAGQSPALGAVPVVFR